MGWVPPPAIRRRCVDVGTRVEQRAERAADAHIFNIRYRIGTVPRTVQ